MAILAVEGNQRGVIEADNHGVLSPTEDTLEAAFAWGHVMPLDVARRERSPIEDVASRLVESLTDEQAVNDGRLEGPRTSYSTNGFPSPDFDPIHLITLHIHCRQARLQQWRRAGPVPPQGLANGAFLESDQGPGSRFLSQDDSI
jgi:hypothetical protein